MALLVTAEQCMLSSYIPSILTMFALAEWLLPCCVTERSFWEQASDINPTITGINNSYGAN